MMQRKFRTIAFAAGCALGVLYAALGVVSMHGPVAPLDTIGASWFGEATELAWIFTQSGYFFALAPIDVLVSIVGAVVVRWRARAFFAVALNLVAWLVSNVLKDVFHRARPAHWLRLHETSYAYSSGHATDAVVVYALWALFLWRSALPAGVRAAAALGLVGWALGISWSRLALGAHYATDVLGGWLLGIALAAFAFAVYPTVNAIPTREA